MADTSEIPTGAVDGNNKVFTATSAIVAQMLFVDRILQIEGVDYTVAGATITFLAAAFPGSTTPGAPPAGSFLRLFRLAQVAPSLAGDVAICNIALLRVGVALEIAAFTDKTKEARVCSRLYVSMREKLLEMYDWSFARGRKVLVASASAVRSGWDFIYDLPVDCLTPRRIWNGQEQSRPEDEIPFTVEPNDAGTSLVLLCNIDSSTTDPELRYTKSLTDPDIFSSLFADALAWLMADELVVPLTVSPTAAATLDGKFEKAMALAVAMDARHMKEGPRPESEFIAARNRRPFFHRPPRIP